jgi:hypothetical protein
LQPLNRVAAKVSKMPRGPLSEVKAQHREAPVTVSASAPAASSTASQVAVPVAGNTIRAIALSTPPHACPQQERRRPAPFFFCRRRQQYKHASVVERPPQSYGQRLKLAEGASARGLTCHCANKAGYMYSYPLNILRVVLLLLRQRRGAGLCELQRARG